LDRVNKYGSPLYSFWLPATAAGISVDYSLETQFPASKKYEPLDWIKVVNNDAVDIRLQLNGNNDVDELIPAGTTVILSDTPIWQYRITNQDAAVATILYAIRISLQRQPLDADKVARGL